MYENQREREKEEEILVDTFGSNEQPALEKIEYQVRVKSTVIICLNLLEVGPGADCVVDCKSRLHSVGCW